MGLFTKNDNTHSSESATTSIAPAIQDVATAASIAASATTQKITLDRLVNLAIEKEASDVHFGQDSKIALRVRGKILFIENVEPLTKDEVNAMVQKMIPTEDEQKRLDKIRELDFSYTHKNGVTFRVNAFYQQNKLAVVMHMIPKHVPSMDELGIPDELMKLLAIRQGLILVCGTAGSGKSTSIQAMLKYVNENFIRHILTIESPIEYVFESKKSIFTQREIGKDTLTMAGALESASRQDANIVMITEIASVEVLEHVFNLVETGHLVIASLSAKDSTLAIERLMSLIPSNHQSTGLARLSDSLVAILSQDLVPRSDQLGQVAIYEFLINDASIANLIKQGQLNQIRGTIHTSSQEGMITLESYARQLQEQGVIDESVASEFRTSG